jgi:hypothetical protein
MKQFKSVAAKGHRDQERFFEGRLNDGKDLYRDVMTERNELQRQLDSAIQDREALDMLNGALHKEVDALKTQVVEVGTLRNVYAASAYEATERALVAENENARLREYISEAYVILTDPHRGYKGRAIGAKLKIAALGTLDDPLPFDAPTDSEHAPDPTFNLDGLRPLPIRTEG